MSAAAVPEQVRRRRHALGFFAGLGAYAIVSWLVAVDVTKLVMWLVVGVAATWWYSRNGGPWFDRRKGIRRSLLQGSGLLAAGLIVVVVAGLLVPNPTAHTESQLPLMSGPQVMYLLIIIPAVEEVLFRGLLFEVFAQRPVWQAVAVTALADSAAHGISHRDLSYALAVLAGGIVLGALRGLTRGLSLPIALHVLVDALAS